MPALRCPGQNMRFWKPEDISETPSPHCKHLVEFWKDEPSQQCAGCGKEVRNPKIDLGCAAWRPYAAQCLGIKEDQTEPRRWMSS